ncbi:MAG: sulfatase-like hydrolase/transferase [Rhodospirillaceae bacterium]|nr:sulfatase-like hydrolase/transferase [Rhodospirillaceae bacterium]
MLKGLMGKVGWPGPKVALALLTLAAAAAYAAIYLDPYIGMLMLPFFALGCARGKHPAVLLALSVLPALLLLAGSLVKFTLTGLPLVYYDQHFLRRNVLMLGFNDWRVATGLIATAVLAALYVRYLFAGRGVFSRFEKYALAALAIVAVGCTLSLRNWTQTIDSWESQLATPTLRTLVASARMPGPQLQLRLTSPAQAAIPPQAAATTTAPELIAPAGALPDLFMVLQETTFNPATVRPDYKPQTLFADNVPQTQGYTGPLYVHTFAGATWKTEFSVAAQMRPQEFGNDGLYVFYQLKGRIKESLFTRLKSLGYRTLVFYPVPGHFINARDFYMSIGADAFYDPESLGLDGGWKWKIPDSVLYDAMLKKLQEETGPVAVMMLTINQHGPHAGDDPMADYMTRFAASDQAYGDFLKALEQRGRPAGVVAFGDHQPDFMATRHVRELWYYTAYDVRCVNFACADRPLTEREDKQIDIVMLTPRALEAFGFKLDGFSALERDLFKHCDHNLSLCTEDSRLGVNAAFSKFFQ